MQAKEKNEEFGKWKRLLQDAYAEIRADQRMYDILVLGHAHMYAELIPSRLVRMFEIFKRDCNFNSNSVFVDLGCGVGKVVYMAFKSGVRESIGIEEEKKHVEEMKKSMKNLTAEGVKIIHGLIEEHLHEVSHVTHLYSFDFVFSPTTLNTIFAFVKKHTGVYWASFQRPADLTARGLKFQILEEITGKMSRSKESHKCYVYKII